MASPKAETQKSTRATVPRTQGATRRLEGRNQTSASCCEMSRRGVRDTLFVLHQERLWRSKSADREGCLAQIAFWEAVLGWIQEQGGDHVNFVGRAR